MAKNKSKIGSKAGLAIVLSGLGGFYEAKVGLEQYPTDGNTAADMLWNALILGDIKDKEVIDLGAGTGILGIGAGLLGANRVILVDKDKTALETAKKNISKLKSDGYRGVDSIFIEETDILGYQARGDTVIENPPFGTKIRHNDAYFLEKALGLASVVYSLHKSESKGFLEKFAAKKGAVITHVWNYELPLKASFEFHRSRIKRIDVSCFRLLSTGK